MYRMRRFEEEVFEFYKRGLMPGLAHLYLGEEAVAAGACVALREDDYIGSTHRGHGHLVARGADLDRMMAEILGKKTGYSKGKGGSMHIMAMDKGLLRQAPGHRAGHPGLFRRLRVQRGDLP